MDNWLEPLRRALDTAPQPLSLFFRDDDAGWADDRLFTLLDLFSRHAMPIDLAVIPLALTPRLADALLARRAQDKVALGLHQHGYAHINHEVIGRKYEFGPSRSMRRQLEELAAGRDRLRALLGDQISLRNLRLILERMLDYEGDLDNFDELNVFVRASFPRQ